MKEIYSYDGIVPVIDPTCFIHDTAVVIGDVLIGPNCYVGPGAVLRGDFGRIVIGEGSNVQETCVIHSFPNQDVVLERNSHIGHGAVLHGCTIGENALIGMNAVVMDKAIVGRDCIVGALAFIKAGAEFEAGQMIAGSPARVLRALSEDEIKWKREGTGVYQTLARIAPEKLKRSVPLDTEEPDRRRVAAPIYDPLLISREK
ncbi:transferase hexapeptide repeat family protein [uncultured Sulfitobacter sp.]|jgi:phenylacetic acid degradation protein|uniref:acyltransferase n=1 Tax=uncultured Sulfitobacter sp. TaxID=191468 RepID=UPI0030FA1C41